MKAISTLHYQTRQLVWRKDGERFNPECTNGTINIKHMEKIDVWGCFSYNGVGRIYKVNGIMNAEDYKKNINLAIKAIS